MGYALNLIASSTDAGRCRLAIVAGKSYGPDGKADRRA